MWQHDSKTNTEELTFRETLDLTRWKTVCLFDFRTTGGTLSNSLLEQLCQV